MYHDTHSHAEGNYIYIIRRHKKCILYDWAMSQKLLVKKFK